MIFCYTHIVVTNNISRFSKLKRDVFLKGFLPSVFALTYSLDLDYFDKSYFDEENFNQALADLSENSETDVGDIIERVSNSENPEIILSYYSNLPNHYRTSRELELERRVDLMRTYVPIFENRDNGNPLSIIKRNNSESLETIINPYLKTGNSYYNTWFPHMQQILNDYGDIFDLATDVYDVPEELYLAILGIENGKPYRGYPTGKSVYSHTGAVGFAQLFPSAAIEAYKFTRENGMTDSPLFSVDEDILYDLIEENPNINILVGAAYLRYLYENFACNDWTVAAQMYNSGPSRVAKVLHKQRGIEDGEWWPPIYNQKGNVNFREMREFLCDRDDDWNYIRTYQSGTYKHIDFPANQYYSFLVTAVAIQPELDWLTNSLEDEESNGLNLKRVNY